MHLTRSAVALAFILGFARSAVSHAQGVDAGRIGVSHMVGAWAAVPLAQDWRDTCVAAAGNVVHMGTHVDTANTTVVRPSHVGRYLTIGTATGLLAGISAVAYEVNSCNGHSTNGIPACLGIDAVAFVTLATGILAGSGIGWISGAVADERHW